MESDFLRENLGINSSFLDKLGRLRSDIIVHDAH